MRLQLLLSTILWLMTTANHNKGNSTIIKASTIVYDQILLSFLSKLDTASQNHRETKNKFMQLNLTSTLKDFNVNTINTRGLPDCTVPKVFNINLPSYNPILAYVQVDKDVLLENKPLTSSFYYFNYTANSWNIEPLLSLNAPVRRSGSSIIISERNNLLLFGGFIMDPNNNNLILTRQLYNFDTINKQWLDMSKSAISSNVPPMAFHSATLIKNNQMVVLGGISLDQLTDEDNKSLDFGIKTNNNLLNSKTNLQYVYIYDIDKDKWIKKSTSNFSDKPRLAQSSTYIEEINSLLIYGGTNQLYNVNNIIYNDVQILNLDNWTWRTLPVLFSNNTLSNIGRAWHSAVLIKDKIMFLYGDIHNNDLDMPDIMVLDIHPLLNNKMNNITCLKWVDEIGPASNVEDQNFDELYKLKTIPNNMLSEINVTEEKSVSDYPIILGVTFGLIGGILLTFLILFLIWKYKLINLNKLKKRNSLDSIPPNHPLLTPIWAHSNSNLSIFNNNNNIDNNNPIWDLDSHYAYSIRDTALAPLQSHHFNTTNHSTNHNTNSTKSEDRTLISTRRWSADFSIESPKLIREVPPSNYKGSSTLLSFNGYTAVDQYHNLKELEGDH